jgi:hypothetical protein
MDRRLAARLLLALVALGAAPLARAGLGEPASSVAADQQKLAAARRQRDARTTHTIEHLVSDARTVREYVSPSGVVFAVAWDGLAPPDLSAVLGAYAAPVRRAIAAQDAPPRSRARHVEAAGAVVETWGHMRSVHGRAYVPALVPAGVSLDEIR